MFTKFATFDSAEILDVRSTSTKQRTASLDKFADYNEYRTSDGYMYARIRAISSRVNKNNDGWPSIELAGSKDLFDQHFASSQDGFTINAAKGSTKHGFATFVGKPIFVDHHNTDPEDTRGVIVDAKLHVEDSKTAAELDPYYASAPDNHKPPTWIELLLEIDAKEYPKFAKAIIEGSKNPKKGIDGFSMGCDVEYTICSHCDNKASSPDDFCEHIKLKGAHLKSKKTGKVEKAFEDCYGIKFFEISGVFDPADETALLREVKSSLVKEAPGNKHLPYATDKENRQYEHIKESCLARGGSEEECKREAAATVNKYRSEHGETKNSSVHVAEEALPQDDHLRAPDPVDTLREDKICPICGSNYDGHTCEVCGYVEPPEGLDNPDLEKAQEENPDIGSGDKQQEENVTELPEAEKGIPDELGPEKPGQSYLDARNEGVTSHVNSEMAWKASRYFDSAKINKGEVPILAGSPPQSNEPAESIIKDPLQPTTARTQENNMSTFRTAADPLPDARADKRVDVTGVGGVIEDSNESASKADAQVDVLGIGGTGVEGVEADEHQSIEETSDNAGFDQGGDKSNNSGPTKTFPNKDQTSPVTSETPSWVDESKWSATDHVAGDNKTLEEQEQQGNKPAAGGGTAVKGVQPVDPVGKADDRVNVLEPTTSPENNSGKTKTWSGTDGNGVTKQQDPVTNEVTKSQGINSHTKSVFQLADEEIALNIIEASEKWDRIAQLETLDETELHGLKAAYARVRTAGLKKPKSEVTTRVPSLRTAAITDVTAASTDIPDEALFA